MIVIILLIPAGVSCCVDLPEPTESSTSNPGTTGTSDSTSDSTNQPTDSQSQTQTTSSSSQSNAATPKAKCDYRSSSQHDFYGIPSESFKTSISPHRSTKRNEAYNDTLTTVDEVTKPTQSHNGCEYDYVQ